MKKLLKLSKTAKIMVSAFAIMLVSGISLTVYAANYTDIGYRELETGEKSLYYKVEGEDDVRYIDTKKCEYEYYLNKYIDFSKVPNLDVEYRDREMKIYQYSDIDLTDALKIDEMLNDGYISQETIYASLNSYLSQYGDDVENLSEEDYLDFSNGNTSNYQDTRTLYLATLTNNSDTLEMLKAKCIAYIIADKIKIDENNEEFISYLANRFCQYTGPDMIKLGLEDCYELPSDMTDEEINYVFYKKCLLDYKLLLLKDYVNTNEEIQNSGMETNPAYFYNFIYDSNEHE